MVIALIFGLFLRSTAKATVGSVGVVLVAYSVVIVNSDVFLFDLAIVLLLPSIVFGSFIRGFISRKIAEQS
jgi:hypothetical protein